MLTLGHSSDSVAQLVERLTPDQKVACSSHVGVTFFQMKPVASHTSECTVLSSRQPAIAQLVERRTVEAMQISLGRWFKSASRESFYFFLKNGAYS